MELNHFSNRIKGEHFDMIIELFKECLGMIELRRNGKCIWMRQPGANIDIQFTKSEVSNRDVDKRGSQIAFLSATPEGELEKLGLWIQSRGLDTTMGSWSEKEYYLDVPDAFVDFVIEAMTADMADYSTSNES